MGCFHLPILNFWGEAVCSFFTFSSGEKVAVRPDEGLGSFSQFLDFLLKTVPHPPSVMVPPPPLGESFQLVDFICKFDLFAPTPGSSEPTQICARCHSGNALPWQLTAAES